MTEFLQVLLDGRTLQRAGTFFVGALVAVALAGVARAIILMLLRRASSVSQRWIDALHKSGVVRWGTILVSVSILDALAPSILSQTEALQPVDRLLSAALIFLTAIVVNRFLSAFVEVAEHSEAVQRLPVKVSFQALQMVVWCYATLMLVSVIMNKDVSSLMTGLTAVGALLVYVFRDYILGWNAAIQIAQNDLVREGDWIIVENRNADGRVTDIGLTTIKIQNWDRSISVIPTYDIVSKGCRNMRFMYESGGRRIKRRFAVDGRRVKVCNQALLDKLFTDPRTKRVYDESGLNEITNLSLFRRWLSDWLNEHSDINHDMTTMVRELNDEGRGVVLEIYAFTATTQWVDHERIKADIHDHVISALIHFDLGLFQDPGGEDLATLAPKQLTSA